MAFKVLIPHGCMARAPVANYKLGPTLVAHPPCHEARSLLLQGWVGKNPTFFFGQCIGCLVFKPKPKKPRFLRIKPMVLLQRSALTLKRTYAFMIPHPKSLLKFIFSMIMFLIYFGSILKKY